MGKDKTKDGETVASEAQDGHWDSQRDHSRDHRDHSQDWEARDATLAKTITEAVTRKMAKAHAQYQAIANEKSTPTLPTSLKITSGSHGFRVMDPFDWTKDKSIYQRWQLWSHRLDSPLMPWREIQ